MKIKYILPIFIISSAAFFDTENKKLESITDRNDEEIVQGGARFAKNSDEIFYITDRDN